LLLLSLLPLLLWREPKRHRKRKAGKKIFFEAATVGWGFYDSYKTRGKEPEKPRKPRKRKRRRRSAHQWRFFCLDYSLVLEEKGQKNLTMSGMLVNCVSCHTPLVLPPGAQSIRCALCNAVTLVNVQLPSAVPTSRSSTPNPLQYSPQPPNPHGSKKALICGINYKYSRYQLKGCINDAKCMKYMLTTKFGFPEASVLMLSGKLLALLPTLKSLIGW
jgi:LSD1 subclass zinc finger protein